MGTFSVTIELGDPQGQRWQSVEALADSGSTFSWAPADVLDDLGVRPSLRREFDLADGQVIERDLAQTWARYEGRTVITILVFGDPGSPVLLGAYTLEGLSLGVDPVNQRLVPVRALAQGRCRAALTYSQYHSWMFQVRPLWPGHRGPGPVKPLRIACTSTW